MRRTALAALAVLALVRGPTAASGQDAACTPGVGDDGGITLPPGFCATVFADDVGAARHLAVAPNGDVFVALANRRGARGGVLALRDTDGDGRADRTERFGDNGGSGIALAPGLLYYATDDAVLRYRLPAGALRPAGRPDTVVSGLPVGGHRAKTIALGPGGALFVNVGSYSNACQVKDRQKGSPGIDPCPELAERAGIWRFDARKTGQTQKDGVRWATGLRNVVALALGPDGALYGAQHGRDQLHQNWPELFTVEDNAEKPSEELVRIGRGDDFGWPYCYHDRQLGAKVLAPEYGGDGREVGRCAGVEGPLVAFPGHWAPIGLAFYTGGRFPARYRGGAFLTFHGSWNRAPLAQAGYNVVFIPMSDGGVTGEWELFADGFAGEQLQPGGAEHRPSGVAAAPDGALFIADDSGGRVWRVDFAGTRR